MKRALLAAIAAIVLTLSPAFAQATSPSLAVVLTQPDGSSTTLSCVAGFAPTPVDALVNGGMMINLTMTTWTGNIANGSTTASYSCNP